MLLVTLTGAAPWAIQLSTPDGTIGLNSEHASISVYLMLKFCIIVLTILDLLQKKESTNFWKSQMHTVRELRMAAMLR